MNYKSHLLWFRRLVTYPTYPGIKKLENITRESYPRHITKREKEDNLSLARRLKQYLDSITLPCLRNNQIAYVH